MKFKSIQEVIEKTKANAKAANCLGKSGAFNTLGEDLNELEAGEYAREVVSFLRGQEEYKQKLIKYEERIRTKEEKFREKVEERRIKQEERETKYQEKLAEYQKRLAYVKERNIVLAAREKKLLKDPKEPVIPKSLKEIPYPKLPDEPKPPVEPARPRIVLSVRERIRLEREMLHIYISGHPLDEVPDKDDITDIKNLADADPKAWCKIRGVLQSLKVTQTRSKQMMARLRIEDKTGSIEVVAFPRIYESLKGTLEEGELYEVLGRVDITKRMSDDGEESTHTQFVGTKVKTIRIGSDKEWDIVYPLLKGSLRILPGRAQRSKGLATTIISNQARRTPEENIGLL